MTRSITRLAQLGLSSILSPLSVLPALGLAVLAYNVAPSSHQDVATIGVLLVTITGLGWFWWRVGSEEDRLRAEWRTACDERLSEKYGVEIQHSSGNLWRIAGELRKATYARTEDALLVGGRELARAAA